MEPCPERHPTSPITPSLATRVPFASRSRTRPATAAREPASYRPPRERYTTTPVNDARTVTTTATNLAYTEGDGAVAADPGVTVSDPDSANLSGAKVSISSNFSSSEDSLSFTNQNGISGSYNAGTGVLTLTG